MKNELRFHRGFDSSIAGSGSSIRFSFFGDTEGGVVGPLTGCVPPASSSESSLLSEPESEPESELELALPELCGAWPAGLGGL